MLGSPFHAFSLGSAGCCRDCAQQRVFCALPALAYLTDSTTFSFRWPSRIRGDNPDDFGRIDRDRSRLFSPRQNPALARVLDWNHSIYSRARAWPGGAALRVGDVRVFCQRAHLKFSTLPARTRLQSLAIATSASICLPP